MSALIKPWPRMLALFGGLLLAGCVTINVYFPEAAAEQAAREIVEDILKDRPNAALAQPSLLARGIERVLDVLVPSAHAAEPNLNIDTAEIRRLRASMKARYPQLAAPISSGAVGFAANGDLTLRAPDQLSLRERAKVKRLVSAENKDRDALYRAIAAANQNPSWAERIRQIFAKQWQDSAPSGAWVESGGWRQK